MTKLQLAMVLSLCLIQLLLVHGRTSGSLHNAVVTSHGDHELRVSIKSAADALPPSSDVKKGVSGGSKPKGGSESFGDGRGIGVAPRNGAAAMSGGKVGAVGLMLVAFALLV
ncbi:hypothetical protein LINPERPRIM_LOCUS7914 [Linum perenne]